MVLPTAHAAGEDQSRMARQHADNAEDALNQAGQHAASAASTVGHDIRQAGHQAAEAARYVGGRLTAPVAGEDPHDTKEQAKGTAEKAKHAADEKVQQVADNSKSTYEKIKNSLGSFMGSTKREATGDDAAHKAADTVNRGLDRAQGKQQEVFEESASKDDVKQQGQQAYDSAKDTAVHAKDAVVGSLSYVKGRLTAPISGEEQKDEDLKEKAQDKTSAAADKVSETAGHVQDKAGDAVEKTKAESKGLFSSITQAFQPKDKPTHASSDKHSVEDKARSTLEDARDTAKSAGDLVKDKVEMAKAQMREAAESVEPKTVAEAVQAEGGIPSNTAELLKEQEFANKATIDEHEAVEGRNIGATDLLDKTAEGWAGENLTGEGSLESVRDAADQAGPHSHFK